MFSIFGTKLKPQKNQPKPNEQIENAAGENTPGLTQESITNLRITNLVFRPVFRPKVSKALKLPQFEQNILNLFPKQAISSKLLKKIDGFLREISELAQFEALWAENFGENLLNWLPQANSDGIKNKQLWYLTILMGEVTDTYSFENNFSWESVEEFNQKAENGEKFSCEFSRCVEIMGNLEDLIEKLKRVLDLKGVFDESEDCLKAVDFFKKWLVFESDENLVDVVEIFTKNVGRFDMALGLTLRMIGLTVSTLIMKICFFKLKRDFELKCEFLK
jgi:hypothetical protein